MPYLKPGLIACWIILFSSACWAWQGQCVGVIDGDTIIVMHENQEFRVNLYGLECPEKGQPFRDMARHYTYRRVCGKVVQIKPLLRDSYGRTQAWVYVGGRNLNHDLVGAGLAWHNFEDAPNPELKSLEKEARARKRGLWIDSKPIPPLAYRKTRR